MMRTFLAVLAGIAAAWVVNMGLITIGPSIVPLPAGADVSTMERLAETIHLFETKNFIFPFLAHALGTLAGALVAALVAVRNKMKIALALGALFLGGGILAAAWIPAPLWFEALDLIVSYIPMAWIGGKLGGGGKNA